jgi:NAD(P)-dependent dehydrogenase (short-subunit alcohol dehydrogenase family)
MRVAIAGAGNVGRSIAQELIENGHTVLLIDRQPSALRPERVPTAEWILADCCEVASLQEADLASCDVVVAATGDDKVNLVLSLLAKTEFAVPRVVARVNRAENEWLFTDQWGVDVSVSKPRLIPAAPRLGPGRHPARQARGRADPGRLAGGRRRTGLRLHHRGRGRRPIGDPRRPPVGVGKEGSLLNAFCIGRVPC